MRILLALVLLSGVASAEVVISKQRVEDCAARGAVWFELEHKDSAPKAEQSTVKLYAKGAMTITEKREATETVRDVRCLSPRDMQDVERLLKKSPWKVTRPKDASMCEATSTQSTVVKVFGKTVFTEIVCNDARLDNKSAAALEKLKARIPAKIRAECLDNPLGCL